MPQLVKGGKYVYAWTTVHSNGKIMVPKEALNEYNLEKCKTVFLMPASKTSGGFTLTTMDLLKDSVFKAVLDSVPQLVKFEVPEGKLVSIKGKNYCWLKMNVDGSIIVPPNVLKVYDVNVNDKLLLGRGSRFALSFLVKGPIIEEAKKHSNIEIY